MAWLALLAPLITWGISALTKQSNNQNQIQQQTALDAVQAQSNEQQAQYGIQLANTQGAAVNPSAQVNQYEQAGLNPALMYSSRGAGGMMVSGLGASGAQAPAVAPPSATDMLGIALAAAQTQADIKLKQAQTANVDADTTNKQHTTPLIDTQTASLTQGINNQVAAQKLTEANTAAQNIANDIQGRSADDQVEILKEKAVKIMNEATSAGVQAGIDQSTIEQKLEIVRQSAIAGLLQNMKTISQTTNIESDTKLNYAKISNTNENTQLQKNTIQVDNAKIMQSARVIEQGWDNLTIQQKQQRVDELYKQGLIDVANKEILIQQINAVMGGFKNVPAFSTKPPF